MLQIETVWYAMLWLSFGAVHSLLAGESAKNLLLPVFGRSYRFSYNLFSAAHIALVLYVGREMLSSLSVSISVLQNFSLYFVIAQWFGIIIVLLALTQYDLGIFSGLKQLFSKSAGDDTELLHVSGIHRYVRHPLYTGVYLYLWGGATTVIGLETALWGSLYLAIGTWFEERRLIRQYGSQYVEYKRQVPGLLPFKGKVIKPLATLRPIRKKAC